MGISPENKKIRARFAILSVDIHTRASIVLSRAFRDAGMEVIYLGFRLTPEMVARAAEQENPDIICLSTHQGFHTQLFPVLVEELKKRKLSIPIVAGGNIPQRDVSLLEGIGITGNFGPGTPIDVIIRHVQERVKGKPEAL